MFARRVAPPACLHAEELNLLMIDKRVEHAGGVASPADAGDDGDD